MEDRFTDIYKKKVWGKDSEGNGTSGTGSKGLTHDIKFHIAELMKHIKETGSNTVMDIGCGDWNFSQHIDWTGLDYTGCDCVQSVIEANQKYKKDNIDFHHADAGQIPYGYDFVILKDVIQHWNDDSINYILPELIKSNKYVYLVNGYKFGRSPQKNSWVYRILDSTYNYHPVDVFKEPLNQMDLDVINIEHRRYKQYVLIENKNLVKDKDGKYYPKDGGIEA